VLHDFLNISKNSKLALSNCHFVVGGPLAVTDANVVLGRILPQYFPQIFGPNEDQPLDVITSRCAFEDLTNVVLHLSCFVTFISKR